MAMSKNIGRYFEFDDSACITTEKHVILAEVHAKRSTHCFAQGALFHRVVYSPYSPHIRLYHANKQQVFYFGYDFSLQELGLTGPDLVNEVCLFLRRGHSVRDKTCTCNPWLPYTRHLDYGLLLERATASVILDTSVTNKRARYQECPHDTATAAGCALTSEQISAELGVASLTTTFVETPRRRCIRDILIDSGQFLNCRRHAHGAGETSATSETSETSETWELSARITVDGEKSLLTYITQKRMGVATTDKHIQYPLLHTDVQSLVQAGDLIHLREQGMLYAVHCRSAQKKCDRDICALWHGNAHPK